MNTKNSQALTPLDIVTIMTDMLNEPAPFTEDTHELVINLFHRLYSEFGKSRWLRGLGNFSPPARRW